MPKRAAARPATVEDLDSEAREIFDSLSPRLQAVFIQRHPPIREGTVARRKMLAALNRQLSSVTNLVTAMAEYLRHVESAVREVEGGGSLEKHRSLTGLPIVSGFKIRQSHRGGPRKRRAVVESPDGTSGEGG